MEHNFRKIGQRSFNSHSDLLRPKELCSSAATIQYITSCRDWGRTGPLFMDIDQLDFQILFIWFHWFYMTVHDRWSVARPGFQRQPDSWHATVLQWHVGFVSERLPFSSVLLFLFLFAIFGFGNCIDLLESLAWSMAGSGYPARSGT